MHNPEFIEQAAQRLLDAAQTHTPCAPVRELIGADDIAAAYQVQQLVNQHREQGGALLVGRKIGLTSPAVQKQLGVNQPDYGAMYNTMQVRNGGSLPMAETMQPKAEAEIAFVLKADIATANPSMEAVAGAVEYGVACIEIAGSRVENWNIRIADTIADNASASHYVLGETKRPINEIDLTGCTMRLLKNGEEASTGTGAACLGSPLIALQWLANAMVEAGTPLKAGQLVLSGALGPMVNAQAGDTIEAHIEGFDPVQVRFT